MAKHFFYTREKQEVKKDENGVAVPLKDEAGAVIPGKFETTTVFMKDSFNTDKVIRTHMLTPTHVVVLLEDGHEESQVVNQTLKNKNKPATPDNIEYVKQRVWIQSEISVKGDEVAKLFEALESI